MQAMVQDYIKDHPECQTMSLEEILLFMPKDSSITKADEEKAKKGNVFGNLNTEDVGDGVKITKKEPDSSKVTRELTLQSGVKVVIENNVATYYDKNGKKISSKLFHQKEGKITVSKSGCYYITNPSGETVYYDKDNNPITKSEYNKQTGKKNICRR